MGCPKRGKAALWGDDFIVGDGHSGERLDLEIGGNVSISHDLLCDTLLRAVGIPIRINLQKIKFRAYRINPRFPKFASSSRLARKPQKYTRLSVQLPFLES